MPAKINGITPPFVPIGGVNGLPTQKPGIPDKGSSFQDVLQDVLNQSNQLRFSAHAQTRMNNRNIAMDANRMEKLIHAVDRARAKGAHDSLILLDDMAFIVNVDNRTVITAMDSESLEENVFTNIDSAILVKSNDREV